jgi:hypothetical protein
MIHIKSIYVCKLFLMCSSNIVMTHCNSTHAHTHTYTHMRTHTYTHKTQCTGTCALPHTHIHKHTHCKHTQEIRKTHIHILAGQGPREQHVGYDSPIHADSVATQNSAACATEARTRAGIAA